jgi:hypothetical protein
LLKKIYNNYIKNSESDGNNQKVLVILNSDYNKNDQMALLELYEYAKYVSSNSYLIMLHEQYETLSYIRDVFLTTDDNYKIDYTWKQRHSRSLTSSHGILKHVPLLNDKEKNKFWYNKKTLLLFAEIAKLQQNKHDSNNDDNDNCLLQHSKNNKINTSKSAVFPAFLIAKESSIDFPALETASILSSMTTIIKATEPHHFSSRTSLLVDTFNNGSYDYSMKMSDAEIALANSHK